MPELFNANVEEIANEYPLRLTDTDVNSIIKLVTVSNLNIETWSFFFEI